MDTPKPLNETIDNNSHAVVRVNETAASARRLIITKRLVMSLPAGSFFASGVLAGLYLDKAIGRKFSGPSWMGIIPESREARQAQWEEIKERGANGRKVWIIEGPGKISKEERMLLETENLPEESFCSLAAKLAGACKNAGTEDYGSEVPF